MPYATDNQVSTAPIAGGIEITQQQYLDAINGMMEGKRVTIENGQLVVAFPPEPEPEPETQDDAE